MLHAVLECEMGKQKQLRNELSGNIRQDLKNS